MIRSLPGGRGLVLIAACVIARLAWSQAPADVAAQLTSLRDGSEPQASALDARAVALCQDAAALARCEAWALDAALGPRADGAQPPLERVAALLSGIREARRRLNGPASEKANLLVRLGEVSQQQEGSAAAQPLIESAAGMLRAAGELFRAAALNEAAEKYSSEGAYDKAEPRYKEALAIVEKAAPESAMVAGILDNLADLYLSEARYADAEPLLSRSLALFEKLMGPDSEAVATPLDNLASLYDYEGAFDKAEPLRLRALEIRRTLAGPDSPDTAMSLNNLATLYYNRGEYQRAEQTYRQALGIREKVLPPGHLDIATSLDDLGQALAAQGLYAEAETRYRGALEIREKTLPPGHPDTARTLDNLGSLYFTQGDYAKAEPPLTRALKIREGALRPGHPDIGASLVSLGRLYVAQGAYAKAEPSYLRALTLAEAANGPDSRATATAATYLAELYRAQGALAKAEPLAERALGILERALPPGHPDIAAAADSLGLLYMARADFAKAEALFLRAMEIDKDSPGNDAVYLHNLALLYFAEKQYAKAEQTDARALAGLEQAWGAGHPGTIGARIDYARELWQLGKRPEARDQLLTANRDLAGFWSTNLLAVEETRRRSLIQEFDSLAPLSLSLAAELQTSDPAGAARLAAAAIGARKGLRGSARQEIFARIRRDRNPEAVALFGKLIAIAGQEGQLSREGGAKAARKLEQLREDENETEKALIEKSPSLRERRETVESAQIAARLASGTAFIDTLRYPQVEPATGKLVEMRYAAVVYRAGAEPRLVFLGAAAPIDQAVERLRSNFRNIWRRCTPGGGCPGGVERVLLDGEPFEANLRNTQADCAQLYQLTMARLRGGVGDARRLIVSPDGRLAEVPWEILRDGSGRYLVEESYRITYTDSARSLVYPPAATKPASPAAIIAEVDYDGKPLRADLAPAPDGFAWPAEETPAGIEGWPMAGGWKPLQGGAEILRTLEELRRAGRLAPVEKLPLGSKEEVMALDRPLALIAHTHGFFRAGAAGSGLGEDGLDSGIVLYGANRVGQPGRVGKDGWLMAREAMLLNLEGTELVALLGCDTGRGVEAGEGVQGLRHALAVAGARSTLLTLWQVGDLSAARFLRELLIRAVGGARTRLEDALAETELAFLHGEVREHNRDAGLNRWRHPYFWAGATLAGEGGVLHLGRSRQTR